MGATTTTVTTGVTSGSRTRPKKPSHNRPADTKRTPSAKASGDDDSDKSEKSLAEKDTAEKVTAEKDVATGSVVEKAIAPQTVESAPVPAKSPEPAVEEKVGAQKEQKVVELATTLSTEVADDVSDPSAGTGPSAPPADSPATWALLAAARRDLAAEKISYQPTIDVDNGVITGTNNGSITSPRNLELTYTVVGDPKAGGKVNLDETTGNFSFLPYTTTATPGGTDKFKVLVAEKTALDDLLEQNQVVKYLVQPILVALHQVPILNVVLSPLIGQSKIVTVNVDVGQLVSDYQNPIAFTTTVISFDGTPISVNYFPKVGLTDGETAPTIFNGPSLATAGYTDPNQVTTVVGLVPGLKTLRPDYNVVTWDPRGEFASGGKLHLDSEDFEARDVSAIISWVAGLNSTAFDPGTSGRTNPLIGMVGGSYGGGIQLTTAGIDKRIDAIAPGIAWNTLNGALYPNHAFKTSWASLLLLSLVVSGSRLDSQIYSGIATGVLFGFLTPRQQEFLSSNSPATVVGDITVPTLFLQGTVDTLFPLQQAIENATALDPSVPVKMIWYCGGHGACLTLDQDQQDAQSAFLVAETLDWLDTYVTNKGTGAPPPVDGPKFEWVDQKGNWYASQYLPSNAGQFNGPTIPVSGGGGILPIVPVIGGSGPQDLTFFPLSLALGAEARDALDIPVPTSTQTTYIVGAPELTFSYSGLGTSRTVYAQLVDDQTGLVLGNIVSPVPVTLDGKTRCVTVSMEDIAYTMDPGDTLTLQIVDSATSFEDFTSFGAIRISDVGLKLPTAASVIPATVPAPADAELATAV